MSWNSEPSTDLARLSKVGEHNECLGILSGLLTLPSSVRLVSMTSVLLDLARFSKVGKHNECLGILSRLLTLPVSVRLASMMSVLEF